MTDDMQRTIRDDLAFMRALAQEGRGAPLLGGAVLATAGAVFGTAALAHWAVTADVLRVSPAWLAGIWTVAMLLFYGALFAMRRGVAARPGAQSPGNRAFGAVWAGLGGALFVVFFAFAAASIRNDTALPMNLFAVVVMAMYGTGWFVANVMSGRRWLFWVGLASLSAAFALGLMAGEEAQFLAYAAALFALVMLPGLVLMRAEPSEIV
jgi:hypothetical protein